MIREGSMVRVAGSGNLGFVSDFEEDVQGDKDDPACVRTVRLFDPSLPMFSMPEEDHFIAELTEVIETDPCEHLAIVQNFEILVIRNSWADDCLPEEHIAIWVVAGEGDTLSVWEHRGWTLPPELLNKCGSSSHSGLAWALMNSEVQNWKQSYCGADDGQIGGNLWSIEVISGTNKFRTGGLDGYPEYLKALCKELRHFGIPVKFESGEGLVYSPIRKKKR